jgi:cytochrome c biogenesis protein CcmG/thiol:disulfide interchange protein DsbE
MLEETLPVAEDTAIPAEPAGWRLPVFPIVAVAVAMALLALLSYGVVSQGQGPLDKGPAPHFTLTTFNGQTISLSDYRGQVVVVNFWASWCPPCREEAPVLERVWRRYRDQGVVFIAVDYIDTEPEARAYIAEFDITYPNGPDLGSRAAKDYHIQGVPETFFVTKVGHIAHVHIGPLDEDTLVSWIEQLRRTTNDQ